MTDAEVKAKVEAAMLAFEDIPFRDLVQVLQRRIGDRRALAYRPALVSANQVLRFNFDDLNRPNQT